MRKKMPGAILAFMLVFLISPETQPITLAFVGDVMLGRGVKAAVTGADAGKIFRQLLPWLFSADAAFGNLESPISVELPPAPDAYNLCAPPDGLEVLRAAGFDLLSTANNHSRDCLTEGAEHRQENETSQRITLAGMKPLDGNSDVEVITVQGIRLGFLAADDVSTPVDLTKLSNAVKTARESGVVVIVSIHWGNEYQGGASPRQIRIARELADAGASLIVGHHPHVTQPADCLHVDGRAEPTLVFYSLGNALFDQFGLPATRRGWMALVRLHPNGAMFYSTVPFDIERQGDQYRLVPGFATSGICSLNPAVEH